LTGLAFSMLYITLPNRRVLWRDALAGGFIAALAFEATKHGFAFYITHFPTYKLVYGAFATIPIFLMWIYLSWVVVLLGAVAAAVLPEWRERESQVEPAPGAQFLDALQVLRVLWEAHRAGEVVSERRLHAVVKVPIHRIEAILETMKSARWAGRVSNGWSLTHDVATIRIADVYDLFVFRRDARLPVRQSGQELDRYALSIADTFEANLGLSIDELFQRTSPAAASDGAPQRGTGAPVSGDATA
jgi:membrane protein